MDLELIEAFRSRSAVLVVGTGASQAISQQNELSGWIGLVRDGIDHLVKIGVKDDRWKQAVVGMIDAASDDDSSFLLQAATQVGDALKATDGLGYRNWLKGTVGSLQKRAEELGKAIVALPAPILTTNYDTLIEQCGLRGSSSWNDAKSMQKVLAHRSSDVGHLHGIWNDPDSVIFTSADYRKLLDSPAAQSIQSAFASSKSIVYIGVGGGLSDPNFSRFLEWQRETFPNPGLSHYRLCLKSEVETLTRFHATDNMVLVAYGDEHHELAPFLTTLALELSDIVPSGSGMNAVGGVEIRELFEQSLIEEVIGRPEGAELELSIENLALEPVLLPIPHAQYVSQKSLKSGNDELKRIDPEADIAAGEVILLVGDEKSGLSFAARWLALKASIVADGLPPIYTNFTQCKKSLRPLEDLIRREGRTAGLPLGKKTQIPAVALVIDDYSPYVAFSELAVRDLSLLALGFTVMTCRQGTEEAVQAQLEAVGIRCRVRYLGRLERGDIEKMAQMAAPMTFGAIAEQVWGLLCSEHLPRTPFNVAQLIYIYQRNGELGGNASSTSILEEFVALLLGRGDPHEDARFNLDHEQKMTLLERLAEGFVINDELGAVESATVAALSSALEDLGWPESPIDILTNFLERQILIRKNGFVVFARGSFLHLFAAKRAQKSMNFRDHLLNRPLYYASAISDYAAIQRHDPVLLERAEQWVDSIHWEESDGAAFAEVELTTPSFEEISPDAEELGDAVGAELATDDASNDDDPPVFPVAKEEDVPPLWRALQTLELASRVVRDADQAGEVVQKQRVLDSLLDKWGATSSAMEEDQDYRKLFQEISSLEERPVDSADLHADAMRSMQTLLPAVFAFAGVTEFLASRRLLIPLERIIADFDSNTSAEKRVTAVYFLIAVAEPGWAEKARTVLSDVGNLWVMRNWMLMLLLYKYMENSTGAEDDTILRTCVDIVARGTKYKDDAERRRHNALLSRQLPQARELERKRQRAQIAIKRDQIALPKPTTTAIAGA
ncbi:SIR2 family protein [Leifsonia sp. A12D58]|uniref:SIR2 family protein n=1 Tax=Leifsonia sp. A12D58 TaxID=3397674 RepID=UPI0039E1DC0E